MNRGLEAVSHPSPLALEQALAGEAGAEVTRHLVSCEVCRATVLAMEAKARSFSSSPRSFRAKDAARKADRRWKQNVAAAVLTPLLFLGLISARWFEREVPVTKDVVAVAPSPAPKLRQGRELLPVRNEPWRTSVRSVPIRGRDVEFGQGGIEASAADGTSKPFTLTHTKVDIDVSGFMQAVTVTQTFSNPFATPVEAVYVFPLPDDAAVHDMTLLAGKRTIRATIQKRGEARAQYEQAKAEGRRAALLDQERPNIFTQSLANLLPGETVKVTLQYVAPLRYDDGVYTLNFPMVVGPRYVPGAALPGESQGTGVVNDTDRVPDASRITPPSARSGRDIEVAVHLDAGTVIEDLWSVSHALGVDRASSREVKLALDPTDTLPNKDLVVRWRIAGDQARAAVMAGGGAFALMLNPERTEAHLPATPKEMVFLIDTSCSMNGAPLAAAKRAMSQALQQMGPDDTFMLIDFAENARAYSDQPLRATPDAVESATRYLQSLPSAGGTNQLAGIRKALGRPEDPSHLRMVLLMTDGFIGNEEEIFAETRALRGNARVFGFGIGSSVNHYLLSRLSDEGRGFYQYLRTDEDPGQAVERFTRRVRRPLITDVQVDWGGLSVADVVPAVIPDLFDAQPLVLNGRYRSAGAGTVTLRGRRAGKPVVFEVAVTFPEVGSPGRALQMAWARKRVEQLSAQQYRGEQREIVEQITAVGLEYHLVTKYTSLVAVDDQRVTTVPSTTVAEPTLVPDATRSNGLLKIIGGQSAFGDALGGEAAGSGHGLGLSGVGVGGGGVGLGNLGTSGGGAVSLGTLGGRGKGGGGLGTGGFSANKSPEPMPPPEADPVLRATRSAGEDSFDKAFGGGRTNEKKSQPTAGYVPPAPGSGGVKETLSQSDIMEVVFAHKAELRVCIERQVRLDPNVHGKLELRWWVDTRGVVTRAELVTKEFENTEAARCLLSLVRSMRFPPHTRPADPIVFPFKF